MDQKVLYEPIKNWLKSKSFEALITGGKLEVVIPIRDLVPMAYKIPDLIGVNDSKQVIIVEAEQNKKNFFDVLGRCMLWKCIATFVYLALPEKECQKAKILEKFGIGLLSIDKNTNEVKELIAMLPQKTTDMFKVHELHPLDSEKERQLATQIKNIIEDSN